MGSCAVIKELIIQMISDLNINCVFMFHLQLLLSVSGKKASFHLELQDNLGFGESMQV